MKKKFKFIDLFAGIGGIRIPFDELGGECVFSSEFDKFAQQTYEANFGEMPSGAPRCSWKRSASCHSLKEHLGELLHVRVPLAVPEHQAIVDAPRGRRRVDRGGSHD